VGRYEMGGVESVGERIRRLRGAEGDDGGAGTSLTERSKTGELKTKIKRGSHRWTQCDDNNVLIVPLAGRERLREAEVTTLNRLQWKSMRFRAGGVVVQEGNQHTPHKCGGRMA